MKKREIFADALAIDDPAARRRFLESACAGDPFLLAEIEDLLVWHERSGAFLESTAVAPTAIGSGHGPQATAESIPPEFPAPDLPPPHVAGFILGAVIGEGGAGRVYEGWQEAPRRRVAVKVLRTVLHGHAATQRFFREAEILARLDHPGIPRVITVQAVRWAGLTVPAIVMELVDGGMPITGWAGRGPEPPAARLAVFREACTAVGHAHRLGIVHRDLKPGNILVDRAGRPRVIDFDWARCRDAALGIDSLGTRTGQLIGTHAYMSPEQFAGDGRIDTRSDVWALGVVLFELLAGRLPFDFRGKTIYEAAALVCGAVAPPVNRFDRRIPRDLAVIVATCLEPRPDRRYDDAAALAADIGRHLAGEPISACPAGFVDGVLQLARRHRAATAATAAVVTALGVATTGIVLFAGRAEQARAAAEQARIAETAALDAARDARDRAERAAREARWGEYVANVRHLAHPRETAAPGGTATVFGSTARLARDLGIGGGTLPLELAVLQSRFDGASARVEVSESITVLARCPAGETVAVGGDAGGVFLADAGDLRTPRRIDAHRSGVTALGFSADGRQLATGGSDGSVRIWDVATGASTIDIPQHARRLGAVVFSPSGTVVATAGDDGNLRLFDAATGQPRHSLHFRRGKIRAVAFRPGDGATVATGSLEGDSVLWDARTGVRLAAFGSRRTRSPAVAYAPDGTLLAVPDDRAGVAIVDGLTGARRHHLAGPGDPVTGLAFSPDGSLLVIVAGDGPVQLWDPRSGRRVAEFDGHRSAVVDAAFSPAGRWLATASSDRAVRIYRTDGGSAAITLRGHETGLARLAWNPDGTRLISTGGNVLRLWENVGTGGPTVLHGSGTPARHVAFSADGGTLIAAWHGSVALWDVATATRRAELSRPGRDESLFALAPAASAAAGLVAAPEGAGGIGVWRCDGGTRIATLPESGAVRSLAFVPADGRLLVAGADGRAILADPHTGAIAARARLVPELLRAVVSADGATVVGAGNDGDIAVWHPGRNEVLQPAGHDGKVRTVVFRPTRRQFVSVGQEGRVVLRDEGTGDVIREIDAFREWVTGVAFSPDGTRLALATISGRLVVHHVDDERVPTVQSGGHDQRINTVVWSPDGTRLVTGSEDHTVRVWDAATGVQIADFDDHAAPVLDVAVSPDGRLMASASADGTVRLWGRSGAEIHAARRSSAR